jgi:hypothetical protein
LFYRFLREVYLGGVYVAHGRKSYGAGKKKEALIIFALSSIPHYLHSFRTPLMNDNVTSIVSNYDDEESAITIQRCWHRIAAVADVQFRKPYLLLIPRRRIAATKLQAMWRSMAFQIDVAVQRAKAIKIQRWWRCKAAQNWYCKIAANIL